MNIFIVEDALFLQEMLCHIFTQQGIKVAGVASSAPSALTKIKALNPDLVLLDLVLPGQNGLSLLKKIHQVSPKIKVLICSSLPYKKTKLKAGKFPPIAGYIQKPFDLDELMSQVLANRHNNHKVA